MKWIFKAALQKALSGLPNGANLNYVFQRRMGSLPVSDSEFLEKVRLASDRISWLERCGNSLPLSSLQCFEFGAGWDLIGPLAYYAIGIDRQIVVDIRRNVHHELLNDALRKFERLRSTIGEHIGRTLRPVDGHPIANIEELEARFGIRYLAPCDAAKTGLPSESIDFISTNSTLEHIPAHSLPSILREAHRLLKNDGLMFHNIDMKDHFSYFDGSITKYNFLTIPNWRWNLVNSSLSYQNRLRLRDYRQLFENAVFRSVGESTINATANDLEDFARLTIDPKFISTDTTSNLATHILSIALKKNVD